MGMMSAPWNWILVGALASLGYLAVAGTQQKGPDPQSPKRKDKLILTEAEWKKRLTPEQYRILRGAGTESPYCSPLYDNHKIGSYHCVGCGLELFRSDSKFISGTGWPSFFQPADKDAVWTKPDYSFGMRRFEIRCSRCDGHLGHVFDDGPKPTGLRFCINGECLKFVEKKAEGDGGAGG